MSIEFVTGYFVEAIKVAMLISAPMLIAGLVIGLMVSIFQAATQINEMTLTFIPKMVVVGIALIVFFPWMLRIILNFTQNIFINIPAFIH